MSVHINRTVASREDLQRIFTYFLDQKVPEVAARFLDAYEETLNFLADFPELGSPWESDRKRLANVRVKSIRGFERYLVFYRFSVHGLHVLRIFHGHQDIENLLFS